MTTKKNPFYPWHCVDWNQPTSVISQELDAPQVTVYRARKRFAPDTIRKHYVRTAVMEDWASEIDWTKSDLKIAKETGRSPSSVWKTRKSLARRAGK
jgi:hypothetical protein